MHAQSCRCSSQHRHAKPHLCAALGLLWSIVEALCRSLLCLSSARPLSLLCHRAPSATEAVGAARLLHPEEGSASTQRWPPWGSSPHASMSASFPHGRPTVIGCPWSPSALAATYSSSTPTHWSSPSRQPVPLPLLWPNDADSPPLDFTTVDNAWWGPIDSVSASNRPPIANSCPSTPPLPALAVSSPSPAGRCR
jgi:hypothetical protein